MTTTPDHEDSQSHPRGEYAARVADMPGVQVADFGPGSSEPVDPLGPLRPARAAAADERGSWRDVVGSILLILTGLLLAAVGAGSWLVASSDLAARSAVEVTAPGSYAVLLVGMVLLVVHLVRVAARARWFALGLHAWVVVAWLAAGPVILTRILPWLAQSAETRNFGLAIALLAGVIAILTASTVGLRRAPTAGVVPAPHVAALGVPPPETSSLTPLRERARHEAAHAVAALAQGSTVESVDIRVDGPFSGSCRTRHARELAPEDVEWARLVVSMAANVADQQAGIRSTASTHDMDMALKQAAALISIGVNPSGYDGPLRFDDLLNAARTRAGEILAANHEALELLTAKLLETAGHATLRRADLLDVEELVHPFDAPAAGHPGGQHATATVPTQSRPHGPSTSTPDAKGGMPENP